jgi:hypothetical protein
VLRGKPVLAPLYSPQIQHRPPRNLTRVSSVSDELSATPCSVKKVSLLGSRWSISYSLYSVLLVFCLFVGRSAVRGALELGKSWRVV